MRELIVIAGPANSGKYPLAKKLLAEDPNRVLVHRDSLRDALHAKIDEWEITLLMQSIAANLMDFGHDPVICAWNLEPDDELLWSLLCQAKSGRLRWLDTRRPEVQAMIPPLEAK